MDQLVYPGCVGGVYQVRVVQAGYRQYTRAGKPGPPVRKTWTTREEDLDPLLDQLLDLLLGPASGPASGPAFAQSPILSAFALGVCAH